MYRLILAQSLKCLKSLKRKNENKNKRRLDYTVVLKCHLNYFASNLFLLIVQIFCFRFTYLVSNWIEHTQVGICCCLSGTTIQWV